MRWLSLPINLRFIHIIWIGWCFDLLYEIYPHNFNWLRPPFLLYKLKEVSFEQVVTQGHIGKAQTEHGPSPH